MLNYILPKNVQEMHEVLMVFYKMNTSGDAYAIYRDCMSLWYDVMEPEEEELPF